MSKARQLADLGNVYDDGALSNRNLLINSAMQVAQRGTSFTGRSLYTLDRWYSDSQPGYSATVTQEDDGALGFGVKYLKIVTGAGAGYSYASQRIENLRQFSNKTVTLSFDYTSTGSFTSSLEYNYGSGGSSMEYDQQGVTVPAAATTTRYTRTFSLPDWSSTKTFGANNTSFMNVLFVGAGTSITIKITNVQLEIGDTATPFEHRSYGDELARCERYYNKFGGVAYAGIMSGMQQSSTISSGALTYPTMRAAPAIGFFDLIATDRTIFDEDATQSGSIAGTKSAYIRFTHGARGSSRDAILLAVKNGTSGKLTLDAEL